MTKKDAVKAFLKKKGFEERIRVQDVPKVHKLLESNQLQHFINQEVLTPKVDKLVKSLKLPTIDGATATISKSTRDNGELAILIKYKGIKETDPIITEIFDDGPAVLTLTISYGFVDAASANDEVSSEYNLVINKDEARLRWGGSLMRDMNYPAFDKKLDRWKLDLPNYLQEQYAKFRKELLKDAKELKKQGEKGSGYKFPLTRE